MCNTIWATSWQNKQNDMCAQQTQISLGIRQVGSESSLCTQWIAKNPSFLHADSEDWTHWADAQADLSLRCLHMSVCWFCHVAAHLYFHCFQCTWLYCQENRTYYLDRVKRIWYLLPMRAVKVQASLRIRAVSPEPPLLAHTSSDSRGTFRQKARSLAPLNGWACAVKVCHDGMLEDTNSLDGAHLQIDLVPDRHSWPPVFSLVPQVWHVTPESTRLDSRNILVLPHHLPASHLHHCLPHWGGKCFFFCHTISFLTDRSGQTVYTHIRLFLKEQSDQGYTVCHSVTSFGRLLYSKTMLFKFKDN